MLEFSYMIPQSTIAKQTTKLQPLILWRSPFQPKKYKNVSFSILHQLIFSYFSQSATCQKQLRQHWMSKWDFCLFLSLWLLLSMCPSICWIKSLNLVAPGACRMFHYVEVYKKTQDTHMSLLCHHST